jgi:hypothetical protein
MRSMPSRLPSWQPSAKHESVGYATSAPPRMLSATAEMVRGCGFTGWTSKYFAIRRPYANGRAARRPPVRRLSRRRTGGDR